MRIALVTVPAALAVSVAVAGCGGSDYAAAGIRASAPTAAAAARHATVKTRHGKLGTFLVDGRGRTLYLFKKDTGRRSRCSGACAQAWPPLTTREKPEAEGAVKASMLSTSRRSGGKKQVLYNGHPLYRFAFDAKPGQTKGEGVDEFGARWYVVAPSGKAIRPASAGAPSGSSTPSPSGSSTPSPSGSSTPSPYGY